MANLILTQLKQEREDAKKSREYFSRIASEAQDDSYAAPNEGERIAKVALASTYRTTAGRFAARILELSAQIAELENPACSPLLTLDQMAAVDETAGLAS